MSIDYYIRFSEIFIAFSLIQQAIEHLYIQKNEKLFWTLKIILSLLLLFSFFSKWVLLALFVHGILALKRFDGPFHGGADRMTMLCLGSLALIHFATEQFKVYIFAYMALQLIASYFIAGLVKAFNPDWWQGKALQDIFSFSAYPQSENFRAFADLSIKLLVFLSSLMIIFELIFPLVLVSKYILYIGIALAILFHLVNTYFFGFNRFVWSWLPAYPALIWFQAYLSSILDKL